MIKGANLKGITIRGVSANPPNVVQEARQINTSTTITAVFSTTPTEGNLILLFMGCIQTRTITPPSGFTVLYALNNTPALVVCYKIAEASESNSYTFTYAGGGSGNNFLHRYEISDFNLETPIQLRGVSGLTAVSSPIKASATDVNVQSKRMLIACWGLTGTVTTTISNSFVNKLPATGTSYSVTARRTYLNSEINQNTTCTTTTNGRGALVQINPKFED
jgi:hypothetical protein